MASAGSQFIELSVTSRPPSGKTEVICNGGFQYRGKLFSATSQKPSLESYSTSAAKRNEKRHNNFKGSNETLDQVQSLQGDKSALLHRPRPPRKVQSATARLERSITNKNNGSSISLASDNSQDLGEKRPSVINLDRVTDVPDYEEEMLSKVTSVRVNSAKHREKFLMSTAIRPSSAKGAIGSPVVKTEELPSSPDATDRIKPSVYGLRIGRQVYGGGIEIQEAWKQTDHNFPYKLSSENAGSKSTELFLKNERQLPATLHPLEAWLQDSVPSSVTGLDPSACLILLSHDYKDVELPEVPTPQAATDDLPYTCVVETPRQKVAKQYSHPFFEKNYLQEEWKCKHNEGIFYQDTISSYRYQPGARTSEKIRKEIAELEDLLNGIGSLTSNCSFVQFQAEIDSAKALAAKLSLLKPRETEEEKDTFGLLKLYRDHEKIIAELHQRRDDCLQELSLLESNS